MKSVLKKSGFLAVLGLVIFSAVASSFTLNRGGEGFEIYLDNKLVMQRFGSEMNNVQNLALDQRSVNGQLAIKYHHCGRVGKNRQVVIRDAQNNLLKEWRFPDVKDAYAAMNFSVKDILTAQKGSRSTTVNLYYSSTELPKGRMLASIVLPAKNITTP